MGALQYNQLNARQFSDLSYGDIQKLMAEYEAIDPMISQVIYEAYIKVTTCHNLNTARDLSSR